MTSVRVFGFGGGDIFRVTSTLGSGTTVEFDGGAGADELTVAGTAAADTYRLTTDRVVFNTTLTVTSKFVETTTLDGAGGIDTLTGDDYGEVFRVTGADSGTVARSNTYTFTSVENLTGGAASDSFTSRAAPCPGRSTAGPGPTRCTGPRRKTLGPSTPGL